MRKGICPYSQKWIQIRGDSEIQNLFTAPLYIFEAQDMEAGVKRRPRT